MLPGLERRPCQEAMAQEVTAAFDQEEIALIEAGTGTGKTLAYLLPAVRSGKRVVISTHTINLQEQILHKDLPQILDALDLDIKAVLVKGMGNYVCLRKIAGSLDPDLLAFEGAATRSDLDFVPHPARWEKVMAERDACTGKRCPHYSECPFFSARAEVDDARILVVNHHLLLADASSEEGILPAYDYLIVDEAHHLEEVATRVFAGGSSRHELTRLLKRIESSEISLLAERARLLDQVAVAFAGLPDGRLREPRQDIEIEALIAGLRHFASSLPKEENLDHQLERHADELENFIAIEWKADEVRHVDRHRAQISLLDVSTLLRTRLFERIASTVLVSATLTTAGHFKFIRQRLGLSDCPVRESVFASPFRYDEQVLFAVPEGLPEPNHPAFLDAACEQLRQAIEISNGGIFALFTSFEMLRSAHARLAPLLPDFELLCQGDLDRNALLEKFRTTDRAVLFGTDSFWEGVDVVGDALRCVVIMRLPFRVPTDPIIEARVESINAAGGSAFFDYLVPQAIVKFKQGFGRLIRSRQDRGCVLCLDSRIISKAYGRQFRSSLPDCRAIFAPPSQVNAAMKKFLSQVLV